MLPGWQHASMTTTWSAISMTVLMVVVVHLLPVSTAVKQMPATLDSGLLILAGGERLLLEKVSGLVAPHFAVVVRGKEGTMINRTVPFPSCLFKASADGIQVDKEDSF